MQSADLPRVCIVILNWNGKNYLEKFLPSVLASSYQNFELIIADNASSDDSVLFIKKNYPHIRIIANAANEGFAKGYNTALKQISSDYYVLLNSDVEVTPGWIEPIMDLMETDKNIAACQPKILSFNNKKQFEYAGACGGWIDQFGYPFGRGRIFELCELDQGQYNSVQQIFWASGAAMFIRSSAYHAVGGLDENFFAHQEEIDLCWRLQLAGFKIYVQPTSVAYHVGGGTLPMGDKRKVYLNFRNNLIMLTKNLPLYERLWKIFFRIGLDSIAAWKGLLAGSTITFNAIAKAHLHYWKWVLFKPYKRANKLLATSKLSGVYKGLIIWDYFIKRRKTFSEITARKN